MFSGSLLQFNVRTSLHGVYPICTLAKYKLRSTDTLRLGTDCMHRCHIASAPLEVVFSILVYCDDASARNFLSTCRGMRRLVSPRLAHLWRHISIRPERNSLSSHLTELLNSTWLLSHVL